MERLIWISLGLNVVSITIMILLLIRKNDIKDWNVGISRWENGQEKLERTVKAEIAENRRESSVSQRFFSDSVLSRMAEIATLQAKQLETFSQQLLTLTQTNEQKLDRVRDQVEERLKLLQADNNRQLEQMRLTVDEKLQATLEKRLGESFKQVSDRLEQVHKGLGEMQNLASGVGDLKRVLTNVKTRGIWGEIHLGNLLEQILTVDQYAKNIATKENSSERVEFAVKLPGREQSEGCVWLPIDAKFPQEDYHRMLEAQDLANPVLVEEAARSLESRIKSEAKAIKEKYMDPPHTTDFAIMFLPVEGLYAEVLRRPGLSDYLLREHRVVVTGPTTLAALLSSLQMGFKTLAVEQRSSEVWALLGAVKTEFGRFGEMLERTQKKLQEASNSIDTAAVKTRTIERKLREVQEMPAAEALALLDE
jgi:DNA recombination protein RmuC